MITLLECLMCFEAVFYFQVIHFSSAAIAAFIAMVGILSIIAQVAKAHLEKYI